MTIDKLKPGITVYDVGRSRMGNTTLRTVTVWTVRIVSVDVATNKVTARWNHNAERTYYQRSWSKWRLKQPVLIRNSFGQARLATRDEIKAMEA